MPEHTKLATCSYCSARTMLVPSARDGHELACGSCGAPLHEMKWLKAPSGTKPAKRKKATGYIPGVHGPEHGARPQSARMGPDPRRRKKRKKPLWKRALSEAVDVIEDIFD
ncbi:hypothetical protein Dshi_2572 [Dinoroseobacter shibae DFL 12 = DSM 16493]|uniref:Uncharacterized protein n=1 Tax=Dinoroseobacter shibae (strain DSM 16493 / NCIMB 14021 / DFL 12) TaxID=398580 RepID=A8LSV6_DINSH|nr:MULTISPECIES: hypothetical protein [Dinoroseobacter]ABV94305.1 hypothetical protein Dshi_2572 [Dinoroseobacter shibae DFL 12 = DSM 16493]MDD9717731.1 hypothetical protein [Dinoroseobacter sp. PD6]URF45740.1 hypothetical protein M8008_13265 [Dinoroseobacter shibae]URF50045.1 hypothetical protein M8007_13265 [Dinoroseobacter shibae]